MQSQFVENAEERKREEQCYVAVVVDMMVVDIAVVGLDSLAANTVVLVAVVVVLVAVVVAVVVIVFVAVVLCLEQGYEASSSSPVLSAVVPSAKQPDPVGYITGDQKDILMSMLGERWSEYEK